MANTFLTNEGADFASASAGSSTASYTIPRTLFNELLMAVRKELVLRQFAAKVIGPESIPGSTITFPEQSPDSMEVVQVSPGSEIPMDAEEYSGFSITPLKYGVRVRVDSETLEDSNFALMELNAQTAGYELADNEEALIVAQLDAASTAGSNNVANSNATLPVTDITASMQLLEAANYRPDVIFCGVEIANDLRNLDIFTAANMSGVNNPSRRLIGRIFDMAVVVTNNVSAKLAYVVDSRFGFLIVDKRPVSIERWRDGSRDTNYMAATQRLGVRYWRAGAVSEITTT